SRRCRCGWENGLDPGESRTMPLTHQQEERARRLHEESVILLAHDHFFPPEDLEELRRGKVTAKILMTVLDARAWSPDTEDYRRSITEQHGWFNTARQTYENVLATIQASPELTLIRSTQDILDAKAQGKIG